MATAHSLSIEECSQGADYILRAAHFRDRGVSEARFVRIFDKDVQESQATPPEQRWFMRDEDDRIFLRTAVLKVFQQPEAAVEHAAEFYHACNIRRNDQVAS